MGVRGGLAAINYHKWRRPINDFLVCSSVVGSLNIMDIPYGASYIAKLAWNLAGEELPEPWKKIINERIDSCHFEYPGSTHAMRVRVEHSPLTPEYELRNSDETAYTGNRSLKAMVKPLPSGGRVYLYKKTYYKPEEFHNSRYDPSFSPLLYPGQTIHGSVLLPDYADGCSVRLYAHNATTDQVVEGEPVTLGKGNWTTLSLTLPHIEAGMLDEAGFVFDMHNDQNVPMELNCFIDDLYFDGKPDYTIDFSKVEEEIWTPLHREISQFTKLKGLFYLEGGKVHLSCADFAEAYTGRHDWDNYTAEFTLTPLTGTHHMMNVRVQGASRSYAVGLSENGKLGLFKNENGYRKLMEVDFAWELRKKYTIAATVCGADILISNEGRELLRFTDKEDPYLTGALGISVQKGSHCSYSSIKIH